MTDLLDANGRPNIANQEPIRVCLSSEGFPFPLPTEDPKELVTMALVANDGHVPTLPVGSLIWENDPLINLLVHEISEGFKELREDIKGSRDAASSELDDTVAEWTQRVDALEADRKNDAHEIQRLRELLEKGGA
jgi:hypothetical protein